MVQVQPGRGLSSDQRLVLVRLIAQALRWGVSVPDMLRSLAPPGRLGKTFRRMAETLVEGSALWEVLRDVGFEPDEVVSVRAAEATGQFDRLIPSLVRRMELKRSVRQGIRSALSRQILTLVLASVTTWGLAERFLPTVAGVVHEMGGTVPAWCIGVLRLGQWGLPAVVGMTVLVWWAAGQAPSRLQGRVDVWIGCIPGLRRFVLEMDWGQAFLTAAAGE
ncbi:MAG: type II secretion system F family protein [Acidobacteria bacterium]|nr:type II secretion system F family protein [Acidobacteriota bacterium]MDW7985080.1 type II secretion system F family protein [Acidobacteriota bacterium]